MWVSDSVSLFQYLCLGASRVSLAASLSLSIFSICLIGTYRLSVVCPDWIISPCRSYFMFYVRIPLYPHPPAAFFLLSCSRFFSASPPTPTSSPSYVPQIDPDTLPGVDLNGACFRYPILQTVRVRLRQPPSPQACMLVHCTYTLRGKYFRGSQDISRGIPS